MDSIPKDEDGRPASRMESVGAAVPNKKLSTKELMASLKHGARLDLEKLTGISERRRCSDGEDTVSLAVKAAKECLLHSRYEANDLEMIINCSISRTYRDKMVIEPSISEIVKKELSADRARTIDICNACAGMFTGMLIMDNYIRRGIVKKGMVISGEHITPVSDSAVRFVRTIASRQMASLTVGDAGAAVVMEANGNGPGSLSFSGFSTLSKYNTLCIGKPCKRSPGAYMETRARKIHQVAKVVSPKILERTFRITDLRPGQIDHLIPHQTSERSIHSGVRLIKRTFGEVPRNVIINLKRYGNTASTTHFLAFYRALRKGTFKKGEKIMMVSHASGMVIGIILFEMDGLVNSYASGD